MQIAALRKFATSPATPSLRLLSKQLRGELMPLKIFVAGGTGVLGRATLPALLAAGHTVRSTARGEAKAEFVRSLGAEPIDCDLYDRSSIRKAIAGCDAAIR